MKRILIALLLLATPAAAEDLNSAAAKSRAHARATYDWVAANGGCNADYIPFEIATYCARYVFGLPMGSEGS